MGLRGFLWVRIMESQNVIGLDYGNSLDWPALENDVAGNVKVRVSLPHHQPEFHNRVILQPRQHSLGSTVKVTLPQKAAVATLSFPGERFVVLLLKQARCPTEKLATVNVTLEEQGGAGDRRLSWSRERREAEHGVRAPHHRVDAALARRSQP